MSDRIEEFEQILKDLGYEDDAPVRPKEQKLLKQTIYMCSNGAIAIYLFFDSAAYLASSYTRCAFNDTSIIILPFQSYLIDLQ